MMDKKKTTGEKILDFLERNSPEKLSFKVMASLDKLSEEAKKEPLTKEQEEKNETLFSFVFAMMFFGFIYFLYWLIF